MKNEKQILKNNINEVSKIIFGNSELHISVFSKEETFDHTERQFDYLCVIEFIQEKIIPEQIARLSKFINKDVFQASQKIFWFVGTNEPHLNSTNKKKSEDFKKNTTLPLFIDDYIFNKLKASFAPDFTKFNKNLSHNKEDVLTYLGTYFPRSFAETYSIFNNVLQNDIVEKSNKEKTEINILDIGSGTGGNLSGLLISFVENISKKININIVAIDGNKEALKLLEKIIFHIQIKYSLNISLNCHYVAFETITDLYENSKQFFEPSFDFIISSKMINEIITKDKDSYYNCYCHFAKYLNDEGFMLMLDVTTKIEVDFMPIFLNKQTNQFIRENGGQFKTLIPTSCSEFDNICKQDCFSNNHFVVSHSKKKNDKTKVAYRIIGKSKFVNLILSKVYFKGRIIGWDNFGNQKYCNLTSSESISQSAYRI